MKDAVATMGAVLDDDVGGRDAVHVAVISVIAGRVLYPGTNVGLLSQHESGEYVVADGFDGMVPIGIVDPFLKAEVRPNERFWLYLYPRTIKSLHHQWTHPAFPDEESGTIYITPAQKLASTKWIEAFAGKYGFTGGRMVAAAGEWVKSGDYWSEGGTFEGETIPDEFWTHYERVTGQSVDHDKKESFFSCSC
jgi:hypothetical protein